MFFLEEFTYGVGLGENGVRSGEGTVVDFGVVMDYGSGCWAGD